EPVAASTPEPPAAAVSFERPRPSEPSVPSPDSPAALSSSSEAPQTPRVGAPPPFSLRRNAAAKVTQDAGPGPVASSGVVAPTPPPKPSESAARRVYRTEF